MPLAIKRKKRCLCCSQTCTPTPTNYEQVMIKYLKYEKHWWNIEVMCTHLINDAQDSSPVAAAHLLLQQTLQLVHLQQPEQVPAEL